MNEWFHKVGVVSILTPSIKMRKFKAQGVQIIVLKGKELEIGRAWI